MGYECFKYEHKYLLDFRYTLSITTIAPTLQLFRSHIRDDTILLQLLLLTPNIGGTLHHDHSAKKDSLEPSHDVVVYLSFRDNCTG
jgi:hypothetical protein